MYCKNCGKEIDNKAVICVHCGVPTGEKNEYECSEKNKWVAFLLCFFLGGLGIHRFYVGKIGTGILWLFTVGLFGIGALVDLIVIVCGKFTDKNGLKLV